MYYICICVYIQIFICCFMCNVSVQWMYIRGRLSTCILLASTPLYVLSVLSACALPAHRNVPNLKVAELFFTMMVNNLLSKEDSLELISALSLSLSISLVFACPVLIQCAFACSQRMFVNFPHIKKKRSRMVQVWFQEFSSVSVARFEVPFSKKKTCFYLCVCVFVCVCVCWHRNTCKGEFVNPASFAQQLSSWAFAEVYPSTLYHSWVPLSFLLRASLFCGSSAEKKKNCIHIH